MSDKSRIWLLRSASWLMLLFAIGWTMLYIFKGFGNPQDPCYWLHKYRTLETGWLSIGTILVGGAWVRLFGAELIGLRVLAWLCVVVAIGLPYCCLLSRDERRANLHWLMLSYALMCYGAFQEFSPGTLTVPLLSLLWVLLALYRRREQSPGLAIALGAVAALAVFARFPNILVVPVLLAAMLIRQERVPSLHQWLDLLWMLLACALTAGVLYGVGYHLIVPTYVDPAMNSHHFGAMFTLLWEKGAMMVGMLLLWCGLMGVGYVASRRLPERWGRWREIVPGIAAGLIVGYYITFVPVMTQWYNFDVTYMVSAFCLLLALWSRQPTLLWGAAVLVVASLGTDTGWLKLFPAVLCLLPVAAVQFAPQWRRYIWPLALGFAITVMVRFHMNSIGSGNMQYADTQSTTSPYKGIYVRAEECQWMEQVVADYDSLSAQGPVWVVGREMHRIRQLTGCHAAYYNEFWSNIFDAVYTKKYRELIERDHPIVICSFAPGFKTKPQYKDGHSALEDMLREEGYSQIDRTQYKYIIYLPPHDTEIQ